MNVNKGFWFGIGCIFLLAACEAPCNSPAVGNPKTEIRPISGFNSVESQGSIDVEILTGTQQEVIVQADEAIIPLIYTEVTGDNKLIISTANNINFCDENIKVIVVTNSYAIREIILSGSGSISSTTLLDSSYNRFLLSGSGMLFSIIETDVLDVQLDGSGEISLSGNNRVSDYSLAGSGNILGFSLSTKNTTVALTGSGQIKTSTADTLAVTLTGSGMVLYKGDPFVVTQISGSGDVVKVP